MGSTLGNSADMMEKLKLRRRSFMIMMDWAEKSRVAIVHISAPHFDFINHFSVAFRLEFNASDVPNSEHAV
jgi:hypothetical protein